MASFGQVVKEGLLGRSDTFKQYNPYNPQQNNVLGQASPYAFGQIQKPQADPFASLGQGYSGVDPFAGLGKGVPFGPIADQAKYNFATQTVPQLAQRFAGGPGGDAMRSSAFQGALGSAGAGLNYNLAALGSQHEFQNQGILQNLAGLKANYGFQGRSLDQQLAGLRSSHQLQQINQLLTLLGIGQQPNYQLGEHKGSPGAIEAGVGGIAKLLYTLATGGLG